MKYILTITMLFLALTLHGNEKTDTEICDFSASVQEVLLCSSHDNYAIENNTLTFSFSTTILNRRAEKFQRLNDCTAHTSPNAISTYKKKILSRENTMNDQTTFYVKRLRRLLI